MCLKSVFYSGTEFVVIVSVKLSNVKVMDNSIIYTDGNNIKVTSSSFCVDRQEYRIDKIKDVKLLKMPARKAPGIILFLAGFALMLLGSLDVFSSIVYSISNDIVALDGNMIAIGLGVVLVIGAIAVSILTRSKYALKITTNKGEERPIESQNKEYVASVVNALKKAYLKYLNNRERRRVMTQSL